MSMKSDNKIKISLAKSYHGAIKRNIYKTTGGYEVEIANLYGIYNISAHPEDASARLFAPIINFSSGGCGSLEYPSTPVPIELAPQSLEYITHATYLFQYLYEHYDELIKEIDNDSNDIDQERD